MQQGWRSKPGDRVIRHPLREEIKPYKVNVGPSPGPPPRKAVSPLILPYSFAALIALGTLLLLLPAANAEGRATPFMDALFTATSAVTVTGLVVVDSATFWSPLGQAIIALLIGIGGLGLMTSATFLFILIGKRITLANRLLVREGLGVNQVGGVVRLTRNIVFTALTLQLAGFVLFLLLFLSYFPPLTALGQAAFHAISAFNNAGFIILPNSISPSLFQTHVPFLMLTALLIVLGGVSYFVLHDIKQMGLRFSRYTLNTKIVLVVNSALWLVGALLFFILEYANPQTLGPLPLVHKVADALFQSISTRTAGFASIDFARTQEATNFFVTGLMFIGGASASTAGGIKVNTLGVVLFALWSYLQGRGHVNAFRSEIPQVQVFRSLVVVAAAVGVVFLFTFLMVLATDGFPILPLFFETFSAFGTVGLSMGITQELPRVAQGLLVVTMFVGKLGPLTLALTLAGREEKALYRYAQERVNIG